MRVLLIEDDHVLGAAIRDHVLTSGHAVDWMLRLDDARLALLSVPYELVLLDLNLPDGRGETLLQQLRDRGIVTPALAHTAARDDAIRERLAALAPLVRRRAAREPLQHITGTAAFRQLSLRVGPGVFVPRPETEGVVQLAIDALRAEASPAPIAVDLGTGSGAIALAMATEVPNARVFAAENSPEAFSWTRRNFDEIGATNATLVFEVELLDVA